MYISYNDITDRVAGPPKWWLDGVPRYCDFSPDEVGGYADEAALLLVEGQCPDGQFEVAVFSSSVNFRFGVRSHLLAYGDIDVGDPPYYIDRSGNDRASPHMSTDTLRILQYWKMDDQRRWQRDPELERPLREGSLDNSLLPSYARLASEQAGPKWDAALATRDAMSVFALLADVDCPFPEEVARLVMWDAASARYQHEHDLIWHEYRGK